jgi:hypothetical protein
LFVLLLLLLLLFVGVFIFEFKFGLLICVKFEDEDEDKVLFSLFVVNFESSLLFPVDAKQLVILKIKKLNLNV